MPIEYISGNIFDSSAHALVNPVNCVGVMGGGLALEFKRKYPTNYEVYKDACTSGKLRPGIVLWEYDSCTCKYIANFPTKDHFINPSKLVYIKEGMEDLVKGIRLHNIGSVAIPKLGCGLGGLEWKEVEKIIVSAVVSEPFVTYLYV
jgi:O-acetyl-ADP-ribose deacetylase (regulator of RNase III)